MRFLPEPPRVESNYGLGFLRGEEEPCRIRRATFPYDASDSRASHMTPPLTEPRPSGSGSASAPPSQSRFSEDPYLVVEPGRHGVRRITGSGGDPARNPALPRNWSAEAECGQNQGLCSSGRSLSLV
jgi:hypothetical protein